jgi:hypothetical protein
MALWQETPRRTIEEGDALKIFFTDEHISEMNAKLLTIESRKDRLLLKYVGHNFSRAKAREYAHHGFARRIQTLARCIENVFRLVPPNTAKVPTKEILRDVEINIQSAIGNAYGCTDNLAWVWVHERGITAERNDVGLRKRHKRVRDTLSPEFSSYLASLDSWFAYLVEYRDAFAHRIPLYVSPGGALKPNHERAQDLENQKVAALNSLDPYEYERLNAEQEKLFVFQPVMCHSYTEMGAPYAFHPQLIADFLTVEELGEKMLAELTSAANLGRANA